MSTAIRLLTAILLLGLFAAVVAAQPFTMTVRQKGNLLTANASVSGPNYQAGVNVSPITMPDGRDAYWVNWFSTTLGGPIPPPPPCPGPTDPPPLPPPIIVSINVAGLMPASAIKVSDGTLSLDLDISKLQPLSYAGGTDCTSGSCIPIFPASFPLKGTFTLLTGSVGTSTFSNNGSRDSQSIDPVCTTTYSFNGTESGGTANFVGTIGYITVTAPPLGSNGSMRVQKGQLRTTSICNPPPPPMQPN
jgi:hypothetical protein